MKKSIKVVLLAALALMLPALAFAQGQGGAGPGQFVVPLGYCQLSTSQLGSSIGLASCVRSSFTGTGSGTNLTTTSVTGIIKVGDVAVSGTGVPAGTTIVSQTSGTPGGAGVYVTSASTTISGTTATFGGIPPGATMVALQADAADVRYRDDGGAPTSSVGMVLHGGGGTTNFPTALYTGTLTALRFITDTGNPILNASFYR